MTVRAIQIGLHPDVVDYDSPDFARFPGLSRERLQAAHEQNIAQLRAAGYEVDGCQIDSGETALETVRRRITDRPYDAVLIGAGVRLAAQNTELFESLVNLVHAELPHARFVFNRTAKATPEDIRRWFPQPDAVR
ncbi:hypothetical protein ABZ805_26890 [Saccharopolyspora sp. NPDC047091]|uniref:hypothetical protein n=1 Tax=Saccharopolyspora sp. NPDC047091 TaxID=3155924 RepID=UPI0033E083B6